MEYFRTTPGSLPAFPSRSRGFQKAAAWWLAQCSRLAYENKRRIAGELEKAAFEKVVFFDVSGTQGYLAVHPGMSGTQRFAILAFRGTENDFTDILTDIRFLKRKTADGNFKAHSGFLLALKQVWGTSFYPPWHGEIKVEWRGTEGISEALEELPASTPVFFTGHSLGAALATLVAKRRKPSALYTFGSPRVAGKDMAAFLNDNLIAYRIVNSTDIVPRVPIPIGYRHVGELVYLTRSNRLLYPVSRVIVIAELVRELSAILTLFFPRGWIKRIRPRLFTNHKIAEYIHKLE